MNKRDNKGRFIRFSIKEALEKKYIVLEHYGGKGLNNTTGRISVPGCLIGKKVKLVVKK